MFCVYVGLVSFGFQMVGQKVPKSLVNCNCVSHRQGYLVGSSLMNKSICYKISDIMVFHFSLLAICHNMKWTLLLYHRFSSEME